MPASNIIRTRKDGTKYFDLSKLHRLDSKKFNEDQLERYRFNYHFNGIHHNRWVKLGFIIFDIKYNETIQQFEYVRISMSNNNRNNERILFDLSVIPVLTDILFDKDFTGDHINPELLANARKVAELLQAMMCGKNIDRNDFRNALTGYNTAINKATNLHSNNHMDQHHPEKLISSEDIDIFMKEKMSAALNELQLAAKIATVFYSNLGITANDLKNILREYFVYSMTEQERNNLTYDNYVRFIQKVASVAIESGKYPLSLLLPIDIMPTEDLINNSKAILEEQLRHIKTTSDAKKIFKDNYFHIDELLHYDADTAESKLYSGEDFIAPNKIPDWTIIKIGNLYIKYYRGIKDVHFNLFISILDNNKQQTTPLFYFNSKKCPHLKFESLLPIDRSHFGEDIKDEINFTETNPIKAALLKLAYNEHISTEELQSCIAYFNEMSESAPNIDQITIAEESLPKHNMQFFMNNIRRIPKTIPELAEKIAAFYFLRVGITDKELGRLLREYIEFNHIDNLTSHKIISDLVVQKFDNGRYNLATIILAENPTRHLNMIIIHARHFPYKPITWPELNNTRVAKSTELKTIDGLQKKPEATKLPIDNLETAKASIQTIIKDEANNKFLKQQLILNLLKNVDLTSEQIEQLFQYIQFFESTINHHQLMFIDAFLSKENTYSYSVFIGDIKKLWLEKLILETEKMSDDEKMGILEQACLSEICNFQRGNFFNPKYTNTRKTIEKTIAQLTSQNKTRIPQSRM